MYTYLEDELRKTNPIGYYSRIVYAFALNTLNTLLGVDGEEEKGSASGGDELNAYAVLAEWDKTIRPISIEQNKLLKVDNSLPAAMTWAEDSNIEVARQLEERLQANYKQIRKEINEVFDSVHSETGFVYKDIDEGQSILVQGNPGFTSVAVKFFYKYSEEANRKLPTLHDITLDFKYEIVSMIISCMWPQVAGAGAGADRPPVELVSHTGYTSGMMIHHFGIEIPEGDSYLNIEGKNFKWVEGRGSVWDDKLQHSAWNRNDTHRRIIINTGILREFPEDLHIANRDLFMNMSESKHVAGIQKFMKVENDYAYALEEGMRRREAREEREKGGMKEGEL